MKSGTRFCETELLTYKTFARARSYLSYRRRECLSRMGFPSPSKIAMFHPLSQSAPNMVKFDLLEPWIPDFYNNSKRTCSLNLLHYFDHIKN